MNNVRRGIKNVFLAFKNFSLRNKRKESCIKKQQDFFTIEYNDALSL